MKNIRLISFGLALITLVSCQSISPNNTDVVISYSGESHADQKLTTDTTALIKTFVSGLGCDVVEHINRKVFSYDPSNGSENHIWGKEGWLATGCGRPFPIYVSFIEDGRGGTFIKLSNNQ